MTDDCKCQCCTFQRKIEAAEAAHRTTCATCGPKQPTKIVMMTPAGSFDFQGRPGQ